MGAQRHQTAVPGVGRGKWRMPAMRQALRESRGCDFIGAGPRDGVTMNGLMFSTCARSVLSRAIPITTFVVWMHASTEVAKNTRFRDVRKPENKDNRSRRCWNW